MGKRDMKPLTAGAHLKRFAAIIDVPVDFVVHWANSYIFCPEEYHHTEKIEPTEELRFQSIKEYIERRIAESSDEKIKQEIREERIAIKMDSGISEAEAIKQTEAGK